MPPLADSSVPPGRTWRIARGISGIVCVAALLVAGLRWSWQGAVRQQQGVDPVRGIDSLERIVLGGIPQWVHLRGHDRNKPLLLWLHGGPGFPQMPFARCNDELARQFVVVHWDMRGAGKSYQRNLPAAALRLDRMVADTDELVTILLARFHRPKCLLVAHSFGTIVGTRAVARHPERFLGYFGIGQLVHLARMEALRYDFALAAARTEGNAAARRDLERIGPPPYSSMSVFEEADRWVGHFADREHAGPARSLFVRLAFSSPEYSWSDLVRIPRGHTLSVGALWRETATVDFFREVPRMEVPIWLFEGRSDRVAPPVLAREWLAALDAPAGKRVVTFANSSHWPFLEEPAAFAAALTELAGAPR